jgi:hypothetical protein
MKMKSGTAARVSSFVTPTVWKKAEVLVERETGRSRSLHLQDFGLLWACLATESEKRGVQLQAR